MAKPALTRKRPGKQHMPECHDEALKLAEHIGVAVVVR